jgi:uncharacterized DUF497 family protein
VITFEDIIWLDVIVDKMSWKHNVTKNEVEEALTGKPRIFRKEVGKVEGEDLYNALGRTENGRYLSIFFIKKLGNRVLIITARDMDRKERRRYEKR